MYNNSYEKIGIKDFEKLEVPSDLRLSELTELAEDVFDKVDIISEYWGRNGEPLLQYFEEEFLTRVRAERQREEQLGIDHLIRKILHSEYTLTDALELNVVTDLVPRIAPLKSKIIALFHDATYRNKPFYVNQDADEEILLEMFALRLKERMVNFARRRIFSGYYVLVQKRRMGIQKS